MNGRRWRAWAPAVLVTALVSGCSVGTQAAPVPLPPGQLPAAVRVIGASGKGPGQITHVFFLSGDRLSDQLRWVPSGDPVANALDALVSGPGPAGDGSPLRTALPGSVTSLAVTVVDGVATVDVPGTLDRLGAHNEVLAVAQIVFTVTAQPGVDAVRLAAGRQPLEVPTGSGQLVARPVTRQDYLALAPRSAQ